MHRVLHGDNLLLLRKMQSESVDLIYIDPPFNTGNKQKRGKISYEDSFEDYESFLVARLREAYRLLKPSGSLFVHLDYREVHYIKVRLDEIFSRERFVNEIIWAYDYGARSKTKWPTKHDNILFYSKGESYCFNFDEMDRIPYMAPGLVGPEKAERGKTPTDTWFITIVPTNGKEKTGYPTQKPLKLLERIIKIHTKPGDLVLDFFAGSGSMLEAAAKNGRDFIGIDKNPQAIEIMRSRLAAYNPVFIPEGISQ